MLMYVCFPYFNHTICYLLSMGHSNYLQFWFVVSLLPTLEKRLYKPFTFDSLDID